MRLHVTYQTGKLAYMRGLHEGPKKIWLLGPFNHGVLCAIVLFSSRHVFASIQGIHVNFFGLVDHMRLSTACGLGPWH